MTAQFGYFLQPQNLQRKSGWQSKWVYRILATHKSQSDVTYSWISESIPSSRFLSKLNISMASPNTTIPTIAIVIIGTIIIKDLVFIFNLWFLKPRKDHCIQIQENNFWQSPFLINYVLSFYGIVIIVFELDSMMPQIVVQMTNRNYCIAYLPKLFVCFCEIRMVWIESCLLIVMSILSV